MNKIMVFFFLILHPKRRNKSLRFRAAGWLQRQL